MSRDPIRAWRTRHARDMYQLLADLVGIQSGSANKKGVDQACRAIRLEMEAMRQQLRDRCRLIANITARCRLPTPT